MRGRMDVNTFERDAAALGFYRRHPALQQYEDPASGHLMRISRRGNRPDYAATLRRMRNALRKL
jgi:hypothetical protein